MVRNEWCAKKVGVAALHAPFPRFDMDIDETHGTSTPNLLRRKLGEDSHTCTKLSVW